MQAGFIGLGNLGIAIAENLLMHRQPLYVYNRTAAKAQPLVEKGAVICTSVKELAATCDVVISIVSDDAALRHITEGPEGIAANLKAGGIHVCMSTILPATATSLEIVHQQHGNHYITAPLMGRPDAARARKLNFLVSGDNAALEQVKPLLTEAGGAAIWEFGEAVSAGAAAKLCSNFLVLSSVTAMAEGIQLARQSGIDPAQWLQMLTSTLFSGPVHQGYGAALLKEGHQPAGFSLKLALKDANLIIAQSQNAHAAMPVGKQVQTLLQQAVAEGFGDYDVTSVKDAIRD
ncbi:NAD(P)-dependent oxidoreductase [Chitinophaga agrisoli]|uniref:NAD(P)-dependent oxidoreductase n=1 Tax=Chitinophaga agrisoli TaxID=2607653 RepID=A0A5B2VJK4_9BACT|nr:NAD(P)-dependent oxidoreductase [Chitinophaga agrisoli]KAA2238726.1 NAD(P)-dependent oxidoreductase [Chitinophaga agrisoli]